MTDSTYMTCISISKLYLKTSISRKSPKSNNYKKCRASICLAQLCIQNKSALVLLTRTTWERDDPLQTTYAALLKLWN